MKKKILCVILSAAMMITSAVIPVMADEGIKVELDGNTLSFDVPPQIINDRTMVPLRAIFEALGASVDWNQETRTVTSTKGDTTIELTIDSNTMYVNGNAVTLDTPACVVNDRTLVPVRAISEAYKTTVYWNDITKTVTISSVSQQDSAQTDSVSAYEKLKNELISKGTYSEKYNHYDLRSEITEITYYPDNGDITIHVYFNLSISNYSYIRLIIRENENPYININVNRDGNSLSIFGHYINSEFVKDDNNSDDIGNEMDIINDGLTIAESALKGYGINITMEDLGIPIGKISSPYEKLKNEVISRGKQLSDGNYGLALDVHSENQTYTCILTYTPQDETVLIGTIIDMTRGTTFVNGLESVYIILAITENGNPHVELDIKQKDGNMLYFQGEYINSKFIKDDKYWSDTGYDSSWIDLMNSFLNVFELTLKTHGINISMKDLGVSTEEPQSKLPLNSNSNNTTSDSTTTKQPTEEPQSKVPLIGYEYGPMTINTNYSTGKHWRTNKISSLTFTKCEMTNIGEYKLYLSMQGVCDDNNADVKAYFYDSNNRVLDEVWFFHDVTPNVEYNVLIDKYVNNNVIDNAVRIEFYSYSGEAAIIQGQ